MKHTQDQTYSQPIQVRDATRRTGTYPHGQGMDGGYLAPLPAVTGYYPDLYASGLQQAVGKVPIFPDQYQQTGAYQGSIYAEQVDQHTVLHVSQTWVPPVCYDRPDGRSDPAAAGLPRPDIDFTSNYFYQQRGATDTHLLDAPGRTFARTGVQDEVSWTWVTSGRMQMAEYDPALLVDIQGRMEMPDTLRAMAPAGAHGWTAQPPTTHQEELNSKAAQLRQSQNTDRNLLANSTYAGQSFGARTRHVGGPASRVSTSVRGGTGNGRG